MILILIYWRQYWCWI